MGQNTPAADASDAVRDEDAHLLGVAEAMLASLGAPVFPRDQPILIRTRTALTGALGEDHLTRARETGRTMSVAKAKELAGAVGQRIEIEDQLQGCSLNCGN
jgi:hypothetical protein